MTSNELQLLENVELKFAFCDTKDKLEKTLNVFLAPVLLKLGSPDEQARKKVMSILAHINKRIKSDLTIALPFDALLSQLDDATVSDFVKNFTLIYIDMAALRMSKEALTPSIPRFLKNIASRTPPQQTVLLHCVLPVLGEWKLEPGQQNAARQDVFEFDSHPKDVPLILQFFRDILLYTPVSTRQNKDDSAMDEDGIAPSEPICRGLSPNAIEAVTKGGKVTWTSSRLLEAKLGIVRFILSNVFTDTERFTLLLAGESNYQEQVVRASEDGLRRWVGKIDLEDPATIQSLYTLYLGTRSKSTKDSRAPASIPLKIRLLEYLCKSMAATNMAGQMILVISDGIHGEYSTAKLRRHSLQFLQWTARMCKEGSISPVASDLVTGLRQFIDENNSSSGHEAELIQGSAYIACGLIARKVPKTVLDNTEMMAAFFNALESAGPNMRVYIQDALSSMIDVVANLPEDSMVYQDLQEIILKAVENSNTSCRYMALKYANAAFPYSCVFARYVCLLGASSTVKLEVKEESARGLHPFVRPESSFAGLTEKVIPASALPRFASLVDYVATHRPGDEYTSNSKSPVVKGYPVEVYSETLRFLRMILVLEANPETILIDDHVETKVDDSMTEDPVALDNVKTQLYSWWADETEGRRLIEQWLQLVEDALDPKLKDATLLSTAAKCLLEVISLGPPSISAIFKTRLNLFKNWALSEKPEARALMSHIFGIIASDPSVPQDQVEAFLSEQCEEVERSEVKQNSTGIDRKHGSILAMGYLLGRCNYRNRGVSEEIARRCVISLAKHLEGPPTTTFFQLASASCQSLAEIGRARMLPLPDRKRKSECMGTEDDSGADPMDVDATSAVTLQDVVEKLIKLVKTCKDTKVQEKATLALGHLTIPMDSQNALMKSIIDALYASADTKQVELFFAGGEAWSAIAFGWQSQALHKYKDISDMAALANPEMVSQGTRRTEILQEAIEKIIRTFVSSDRSWYRKAACIWLLSILKFGKDQPLIKTNLGIIHASFSRLLGDGDDFTQEVASKGVGLVYEYGDAKLKEDMLYSLVGTFTEGRTIQAQSVTNNTVLFEEGSLGTTPEGSSITTYKELCSLASELNQPDLIYKFMNLANHNAMWTSRRGAAFGFQNLMSLAEKEMEPYLPRLIPKLYRYQFDPNPRVNQSMKSIWRSLVKDAQKTVDTYFAEIMEDVLSGLGNRQWRIREASAAAVTDLVQGRQLAQIEPYLERLWQMSFRAIDDIKGSVRQAATQTCKSLTKLTVHYCDPNLVSVADGAKVINIVMPFLLEKGIVSDAEDVRKFSLDAVLKVCKTGAVFLKAFIPELVDTLLQSLSSLEPQSMNYLSFHVDKYNISQEQLDNARLSGAKNSPMMDGIEYCVNHIDEEVMAKLSPRIIHLVKKGTGLPTKAGCAKFIVTLCMNRRTIFEPYADNCLKALSGAIRSKNPVIRKTFATAAGYVCQLATYDRLLSLIKHLKKLYIEEEDEDSHAASAVTMVEMTRFATDRIKAVASDAVPLIYFGEHDTDKDLSKLWKDAWEHLTSGIRSMVTLHADEILTFTQPLLSSPSWSVKQTAALTIADMCKSGGNGIRPHVDKLMPAMVSTLATRSWDGKEHVLEAFVQLCKTAPDYFQPDKQPSLEEAAKIMLREAKRKNRVYQRHALASLTTFANAFGEKVDLLDAVQEFLTELATMDENEAMEEDDFSKPLLLQIKANAFEALAASFRPKAYGSQAAQTNPLCQTLTSSLQDNVWNVKLAIMRSLKVVLERIEGPMLTDQAIQDILKACDQCTSDMKYTAIRTAGMDVLDAVVPYAKNNHKTTFLSLIESSLQREVDASLQMRLQALKRAE